MRIKVRSLYRTIRHTKRDGKPRRAYLIYFVAPSSMKEVLIYMAEVMISRRGGGSGSGNAKLVTEYLTFNYNWVVPEGVKNNEFDVRLIGGGGSVTSGSTSNYFGGGSGWMNNTEGLELQPGQKIPITIGRGGASLNGQTGGTTSFGTYLSGDGGDSNGRGGAGGWRQIYGKDDSRGYQFGGGGGYPQSIINNNVCRGGVWGGGGSITSSGSLAIGVNGPNAACGGTYGGGGAVFRVSTQRSNYTWLGRGGTYGGSGAIGFNWYEVVGGNVGGISDVNSTYNGGRGGFGYAAGSGTNMSITGSLRNGVNTIGWTNTTIDELNNKYMTGAGLSVKPSAFWVNYWWGEYRDAGIFNLNNSTIRQMATIVFSSAGGGYGGNAGVVNNHGGGGGGYGSNGNLGGGGYGGDGGECGGGGYGSVSIGKYGGGGYYCPGGGIGGFNNGGTVYYYDTTGGGGYGIWSDNEMIASFGSGCSGIVHDAEPGIIVIKYYLK